MYHKALRIAMAVASVALVFESGLVDDSTARMSQQTHQYLANAVGMTTSVSPTELNQYTAALTAKEKALADREAALEERELSIGLSSGVSTPGNQQATYILASVLFILLALILLNYILDYMRLRRESVVQV